MSSLLDILHRKESRGDQDEMPAVHVEPAAPTVELHLAVDNGPAEPAVEPVAEPAERIPPAVQPPAWTPPEGDATRVLMARQQKRRSRRGTLLLVAGLAVIVVCAGLATWLLDASRSLDASDASQFTAPPVPAPAAPGTVERPVAPTAPAATVPAAPEAASPVTAPVAASNPMAPDPFEGQDETEDATWYDTPAVEEQAEPIRIRKGTATNPLFPKLSEAFAAFQAADFARAEALYREVRKAEPGNVDALLGLGALAARGGRTAEAREHYQSVLLAEPRNSAAIGALSMLPASGSASPDESTLKTLLRDQPAAANLHFALGLQFMTAGRWPDAQVAFFDAVRHEPANADYAYNLAVSLDHLGQSAPAAAYYQRALELATASSLFDTAAATERLTALRAATP